MNTLMISGYAVSVVRKEGYTVFGLSVARRGKNVPAEQPSFLINVRMFGPDPGLRSSQYVSITGYLDSRRFRGRAFYEIICDSKGVSIRDEGYRNAEGMPPGYPAEPEDEIEEDEQPF